MRSKLYFVNMKPSASYRREEGPHIFDQQAASETVLNIHLESLHNEGKKFTRPVHIDVIFYVPQGCYKSQEGPHIMNLWTFLLESLTATILENQRLIYSLKLSKKFSKRPRYEIYIREITHEEKNE